MRRGLAALFVAGALAAGCSREPRQVLLVTIDTLRADHVGARRGAVALTPELDRLAKDSVVYQDALANASLTVPSHASLFSGLQAFHHRVQSNKMGIDESVPWLPVFLRERGFATGAVVSSVALKAKPSGFGRGFDFYDDSFDSQERNRKKKQQVKTPGLATERAVDWLQKQRGRDFFLWVHYLPPHGPYLPPAAYFEGLPGEAREKALELSESNLEKGRLPAYQERPGERDPGAYRRAYAAHVRYADDNLGELFDTLRRLGLYEKAAIIVTSDHGESLGERDFFFCHGNHVYDEQVKVPLVLKRRGNRDAGRVVTQPVELVDLPATLAQELGLSGLHATDGRSILPESLGGTGGPRVRYTLAQNRWQVALLAGAYKYVLPLVPRLESETSPRSARLFDLRKDPGESEDVAAAHPDESERFEAALRQRFSDAAFDTGETQDAGRDEALRALGYVN